MRYFRDLVRTEEVDCSIGGDDRRPVGGGGGDGGTELAEGQRVGALGVWVEESQTGWVVDCSRQGRLCRSFIIT